MPVIPALGRQRQEDAELEAILGYIARSCSAEGNRKLFNGHRASVLQDESFEMDGCEAYTTL
jgi:hypothetical protein